MQGSDLDIDELSATARRGGRRRSAAGDEACHLLQLICGLPHLSNLQLTTCLQKVEGGRIAGRRPDFHGNDPNLN